MFFEWKNGGKVWEAPCTSYAVIRVMAVRVMWSLLYLITCQITTIKDHFHKLTIKSVEQALDIG